MASGPSGRATRLRHSRTTNVKASFSAACWDGGWSPAPDRQHPDDLQQDAVQTSQSSGRPPSDVVARDWEGGEGGRGRSKAVPGGPRRSQPAGSSVASRTRPCPSLPYRISPHFPPISPIPHSPFPIPHSPTPPLLFKGAMPRSYGRCESTVPRNPISPHTKPHEAQNVQIAAGLQCATTVASVERIRTPPFRTLYRGRLGLGLGHGKLAGAAALRASVAQATPTPERRALPS